MLEATITSPSWRSASGIQDPNREPGDVAGDLPWVRYSDPKVKEFKLNAERNNGRAAMMGIVGMVIHESLTGNPLFPLNAPVA